MADEKWKQYKFTQDINMKLFINFRQDPTMFFYN